MSNAAAGTVWNDLNYLGQLFTASPTNTPLLAMSGGLNGVYTTDNFEFPVAQTYDHETAAQPSITETASLTAPTAITYVRTQVKNVCQTHHEQVSLSYNKLANAGRISGIATQGKNVIPVNELDFQIATVLEKIARDVEFSIIQGTYGISTSAAAANTTRGLNACAVAGSTTIAAGGAALSKSFMDNLLATMFAAGAQFKNPVIVVNAHQKIMLSSIYGYAPTDRNIGGVNVKTLETDFGTLGVLLNPFQLTSVVLVADMSFVKIVSQPVKGKGHLFYEPLSKAGAAESGQVFGLIGLDHGPYFMHGSITGLATS
jgi:hypothetical protein